jgi:catechol 2,3-dioxygenase-like lactoylglutathione lyase family enzyme
MPPTLKHGKICHVELPASDVERSASFYERVFDWRPRRHPEVVGQGRTSALGYAAFFPTPRADRVFPGHLVAVTAAPDGTELVVWRWFDAVVLGEEGELVRLWDPAHGEVLARPRRVRRWPPGTRTYASAGLPGADWWAAGAVESRAEDAEVDLDEVRRFLTSHQLWNRLT